MENRTIKRLLAASGLLGLVLVGSTAGFVAVEGMAWVDALYFSVVTVATVGYGDIHPATSAGKLLAVTVIVTGAGSFLGVIANATELFLERRSERLRLERMNTLIGLFFSEIGNRLLSFFVNADPDAALHRDAFLVDNTWAPARFAAATKLAASRAVHVDPARLDLVALREFFAENADILIRLLENPNLHEHESFTSLLRAVFHFRDEIRGRERFGDLPKSDLDHLAGDARRIYALLVPAWLGHLAYLKANYPFLYSLAVRMNPYKADASPVVGKEG